MPLRSTTCRRRLMGLNTLDWVLLIARAGELVCRSLGKCRLRLCSLMKSLLHLVLDSCGALRRQHLQWVRLTREISVL